MQTKTKNIIYVVSAVVLLGAVLSFSFWKKGGQQPASENTTSSVDNTNSAVSNKSSSGVSLPATQRYLDAIKIYKTSGYYFQFVDCSGRPGSQTLKAGVKFMLDNRDNETHKIAVQGGQSFTIGAYNFAIATAPSKVGTHYITCDGGGAASIIVQK